MYCNNALFNSGHVSDERAPPLRLLMRLHKIENICLEDKVIHSVRYPTRDNSASYHKRLL